jgi:hypothetical protein
VTTEQDELDAYFWKRTKIIVIIVPLATIGGLLAGPFKENRYDSVIYHSDKTAAVVADKTEYTPWYALDSRYRVTYDYTIEDRSYRNTEDMKYKGCFDKLIAGQQTYIYYDRNQPQQSYTECNLNRLAGRKAIQ